MSLVQQSDPVQQPDPEAEPVRVTAVSGSGRRHLLLAPRKAEGSPIGTAQPPAGSGERTRADGTGAMVTPSVAAGSALARRLEAAPAEEVVGWAVDLFGPRLSLVCSFQNCVLIDLATRVDPLVEFIFLDTGSHFAETLAFAGEVRTRYELNLRVTTPGPDAEAWPCGSERCCEQRKVTPLNRAVAGQTAWMTGLKRVDTPDRATGPVVGWDCSRGLVNVNPLARWSHDDVARYEADHRLPIHPSRHAGYSSIGCSPTTRPVSLFEDPRAGRWPGTGKTERGLHTT